MGHDAFFGFRHLQLSDPRRPRRSPWFRVSWSLATSGSAAFATKEPGQPGHEDALTGLVGGDEVGDPRSLAHLLPALVAETDKPVVAVVDTNCSPEGVDYIIPGNDDAMRAIELYAALIADAVIEGKASLPEVALGEDEFVELDEEGNVKKAGDRKKKGARKPARKPAVKKKAAAKAKMNRAPMILSNGFQIFPISSIRARTVRPSRATPFRTASPNSCCP